MCQMRQSWLTRRIDGTLFTLIVPNTDSVSAQTPKDVAVFMREILKLVEA